MFYRSPYGLLDYQISANGALHRLRFIPNEHVTGALPHEGAPNPQRTPAEQFFEEELTAYFNHRLTVFRTPSEPQGGTHFQQQVWQALQAIPYGETRSYLDIATAIGNPKAVRAIGQANKANPIALVIPCHRVIGKNGQLIGYMGNSPEGRQLKAHLLQHEKKS